MRTRQIAPRAEAVTLWINHAGCARGEIDETGYRSRLAALRGGVLTPH